ncbi:MAG: DNA polymerase III subunit alpha [Actinomycetota bacterium]
MTDALAPAMNTPKFAHLSVRTVYSLREGAIRPAELAARTAALGMSAVAITDSNGLYGAVRFAQACAHYGVKPVYGVRLTTGDPRNPAGRFVLTLLARDNDGYTNLCRLITTAHHNADRGDPCATPDDVLQHADGLFLLLGPESDAGMLLARRRFDEALHKAKRWQHRFGRRFVIETRNLLEQGSAITMQDTLRLADHLECKAVITNAVRAAGPADAFVPDVLDAMRKLMPVSESTREATNYEATLKSPAEMRELARGRNDLLETAWHIAQECTVDIGLGQIHLPRYEIPAGASVTSVNGLLAKRCFDGLARRGFNEHDPRVRERLDAEIGLTVRLGFSGYFLTVADIVRTIKRKGIRSACRGSAAGSLICYLLGISEVDPIEHNLLFERFVNPYRTELPDIDLDVESARREEIYTDILSAFPRDRVACVAMVDTYRARGALREVGKALGYPQGEVDVVAKAFPHVGASHIRESLKHLPELKRSSLGKGQLDLLFAVAERLDAFPRHLALHPSGILIAPDDLITRTPLERSANGFRMAQFDKDDVEALGLLKLDVIGIRMLSTMSHALGEITRTTAQTIDLDAIPRDDDATFELVRASNTLGCFQIESPGQRELLAKFQPSRWKDLIVDISLFRPGPVQSDMISPYLNRRSGDQNPIYAHPDMRPFMQETFGIIVYHEQVMRAIAVATGVDLGKADQIRRELEDQEKLPEIEAWFHRAARARGWDEKSAAAVWHEVASFASFGFCKAHAAAFAVPTYQSAWLKAHHPAAFYAGVLTHEPGMYPRRAILDDARNNGMKIHPIDINQSERHYTVDHDQKGVRIGLMHVDGISAAEIQAILHARESGPFEGLADLCSRTRISRPTVEKLIHAGACDAFGARRDLHLKVHDFWEKRQPRAEKTQGTLKVAEAPPSYGLRPYNEAEKVRAELEVLGMDVSRHVISFYEPVLDALRVTRTQGLRRTRRAQRVMVAGVKVASQTPAVRSGQRIIFLTLDDGTGLVDATVFESVQEHCAWTVFHSWLIVARGTVHRTGKRGISINVERAWDLSALAKDYKAGTFDPKLLWEEGVAEIQAAERERFAIARAKKNGTFVAPAAKMRDAQMVLPLPSATADSGQAAPRKLWHSSTGSAGA